MCATFALGAEGVQVGSRFAVAKESSAHENFKRRVFSTDEGGTMLALKKIAPTRLIKNEFYDQVRQLEDSGASAEQLKELLGKGRAKAGIFEGDLVNGELEIGQVASQLEREESVEEIIRDMIEQFNHTASRLADIRM